MPALIVIGLRLALPLTILRWPLAGGVLAMVVDALDVVLVDAIARAVGQPPEFGPFYAQIDKWLDLYYLGLELIVVRRWPELLPRRAATGLFAWRLIGVILFEITAYRPLLVVFPNLFENLYLYVLVVRRWFSWLMPRTVAQTLLVLVVLLIPKLIQEWVLHWEELHPWQWLRETFVVPILGG
ncbi:MAG: hypothetical protein EPO36_08565 [Chloroflexota bacterium]|nr:MAG: hypothetical protein EPO36_08565 [Chloroflexota bacterium]